MLTDAERPVPFGGEDDPPVPYLPDVTSMANAEAAEAYARAKAGAAAHGAHGRSQVAFCCQPLPR